MEEPKNNRQKNTYLVLIAAGVFILLERFIGFWNLMGLLLILYGVHVLRSGGGDKKGYILVIAGAFFVAGGPLALIIGVVLISLGLFYKKSKELHQDGDFTQKQSLIGSIRYDREPWVLRNMSIWHAVGEMRFDFSLALQEEKEVTVVLQGMIGNLNIIIPEDMAVSVEGSVQAGSLNVGGTKREGIGNKISWQSPGYETAETKVKLMASYLVGEVNIKIV
ncbi:cell wall-active antibiotics response protein LiaF [Gorillibacterium timonense]|uniref:cell wall-active antibiotics response protein LiaF n=1 Tax=Gorillibacterium timonense TaxID=1689269 RepID=UPI00071CD1ED|nr:cell wall-active antibiotics response protein LiaF [Gorillibacterium timonense]